MLTLLWGVTILLALPALAATTVFGPTSEYEVGWAPFSVTVGNFNGDGARDLAVMNHLDQTVSILVGKGDGTFTSKGLVNAGGVVAATGDFNEDGKQDLATAGCTTDTSVGVCILQGKGDGTFTVSATIPLGNGSKPFSIASGDFNKDGHVDLAVPLAGFIKVAILLGAGNGTFTRAADLSVPFDYGELVGIAVADLNGDTRQDLVVSDHYYSDVITYLGNGNGTFGTGRRFDTGVGDPTNVVISDFNEDGRRDVAVVNDVQFTNQVSILIGKGDGTFEPFRSVQLGQTNAKAITIAVGDFNEDCHADLATADGGTSESMLSISVLLGDGKGTFQNAQPFEAGLAPYLLAAGDFNNDGASDLAIPNRDDFPGTVTVALSTVAGPCVASDTVAITRATYSVARQRLTVEATSTSNTATLTVSVTATGQVIGQLKHVGSGKYRGAFSWPSNPEQITVTSNLGGSATATVTAQ